MKFIIPIAATIIIGIIIAIVVTRDEDVISPAPQYAAHIEAMKSIKRQFDSAQTPVERAAAKKKYAIASSKFMKANNLSPAVYNRRVGNRVWLDGYFVETEDIAKEEKSAPEIEKTNEDVADDRNARHRKLRYELGLD